MRTLKKKFFVKTVYFDDSLLNRSFLPKDLSYTLFALYPYLVKDAYDLIFTSDSYVFADLVYVQPPAGHDVCLPVKDNIFFDGGGIFNFASKMLEIPLNKIVASNALFIANSKYTQSLIRKFYGKSSELLYPPVPIHFYRVKQGDRKNVVVTISGLNPKKNLEILPELCKMVPEAHFILVGYYNPQYDYIIKNILKRCREEGLTDRFTYLPSASDWTKKAILEMAKVLFHPTVCEPFGISIAEGMSAGLIPIAHNSGGPREFVPKEWRYDEVEEAASKIREALQTWNVRVAEELRAMVYYFREERFEAELLRIIEVYLERRSLNS